MYSVSIPNSLAKPSIPSTLNSSDIKSSKVIPGSALAVLSISAFKLPLNEFITGAKFLLRDPYTHPLVKSSLVELLSKLQVADPVTVYWLDKKEYTVVPADIQPLNLLPVVSEGKRLITEKCGNQNPQTEKMAIQEFQLQVMFLYPRINQIIKDIDEWTDVLIARIEGKKVATNTVSSTWQERLGKQIDELIEKH